MNSATIICNPTDLFKKARLLSKKKYRTLFQAFLVEGEKNVLEVVNSSWEIEVVFYHKPFPFLNSKNNKFHTIELSKPQLHSISTLKTNDTLLAIVKNPKQNTPKEIEIHIFLENLQTPTNLGAILRIADWYGIGDIFCSKNTVEKFNPKCIAASMGSFLRVNTHYMDIEPSLKNISREHTIFSTHTSGENIHNIEFPSRFALIFGNESVGVSDRLKEMADRHISIPRIGEAASLNVAISMGITLDNIFRNR